MKNPKNWVLWGKIPILFGFAPGLWRIFEKINENSNEKSKNWVLWGKIPILFGFAPGRWRNFEKIYENSNEKFKEFRLLLSKIPIFSSKLLAFLQKSRINRQFCQFLNFTYKIAIFNENSKIF